MITKTPTIALSPTEQSQIERIGEAKILWREGRSEDALILVESVKSEAMTPFVAAECYVNEAVFYAEAGDFGQSMKSLDKAAPFIDSASVSARGTFHNQRARISNHFKNTDSALTDYAGAAALWEETGNKEKQGAAYLNVAECYLKLGDADEAQANLRKAFSLLGKSLYLPQAHDTQAKIHLATGRLADAAKSIATALSMDCPDTWRAEFLATKDQVEERLLEALQVGKFSEWETIKLNMVRRALQRSAGNPAGAASLLGVTRFAIQSLIDHHPKELEPYRKQKRVRRKSLIKQKCI